MKIDIILAGVGGQGILSIAAIIGQAALLNNLNIKQSEVHGMSQRGGAVMSHLRLSSKPVSSDLIPFGKADMIISLEPMESLRYLDYLSPDGWVITNTQIIENIDNYPGYERIIQSIRDLPNRIFVDADQIAHDIGSMKASNMVMLGAAMHFLKLNKESINQSVIYIFSSKGDHIVEMNLNALQAGIEYTQSYITNEKMI